MTTLRPIKNITIICNKCGEEMGIIDKKGIFIPNDKILDTTYFRCRFYDVKDDGEHLYDYEFELDLCSICEGDFQKMIKKFKIKKATK
jgi:hypothetical protein